MNNTDVLRARIMSISDSIRFGGLHREMELDQQIAIARARYARSVMLSKILGWERGEATPSASAREVYKPMTLLVPTREVSCAYCGTVVLMTRVRCESCGAPRKA